MHRFAVLRAPVGNRATRERLDALCEVLASRGYEKLIDRRGVLLLLRRDAADVPQLVLSDACGAIIGPLFRPGVDDGDARVAAFAPSEELEILKSSGAALISGYWGHYVAVLADRDRDRLVVVRDPSGGRACFATMRDDVRVFASDPADIPGPVEIDQVRLAGFLSHGRLSLARSGVVGIEEVVPGAAWCATRDGERRTQLWGPMARSGPARPPGEIGARVKHAIDAVALGLTAGRQRVVHRLSGGLDSAIVLASLARGRARHGFDLACVTEYAAEAPEGDERVLARETAARFQCELIEMRFTPRPFTEIRVLERWSPTPGLQGLNSGAVGFIAGMAEYAGALLTSGQGGDHLFQRNRTLHLSADAARRGDLTFDLAMSLARMAGVSVWRVWSQALRHGLMRRRLRPSEYVVPTSAANTALAQQAIGEQFRHPWLAGWERAPTAEVLRALHVLEATHYHAASVWHEAFTPAPILVSQPVMEACLAARTYVMAPAWNAV